MEEFFGILFSEKNFMKILYRKIPKPTNVCVEFKLVPYAFVADDAFTLTNNMMKPYIKSNLIQTQRIFNYRLSRARRIIENAFGILCSKWRIFRSPIISKLDTVESIIMLCVCLHNWLRKQRCRNYFNPGLVDVEENGNIINGSWRIKPNNLQPLQPNKLNSANAAKETRNKFAEYFTANGAVSWQLDRIQITLSILHGQNIFIYIYI